MQSNLKSNGHRGMLVPKNKGEWKSPVRYLLYLRHLKAYQFAIEFIEGKTFLEIGFGSGYGMGYLSEYAARGVGAEVSSDAILLSKKRNKEIDNSYVLIPKTWTMEGLPFADKSFPACVSFQVIEHIEPKEIDGYLSQIKRILTESGAFILSTPNAKLRLLPFQKPWNPYHLKEYTATEFHELLENHFRSVQLYGLYATREISEIEHNRVRQKPILFYLVKPIRRMLSALGIVRKRFANSNSQKNVENPKETINDYSLDDFRVLPGNLDKSLDLIAICRK